VAKAIAELTRAFGLKPGDSLQAVEDEYFSGSLIPQSDWPALFAALSQGSAADQKHREALEVARTAVGRPRLDAYLQVFCKADRTARERILTNALADKHPQWAERLKNEQERVCKLVARELAIRARDRSAALLTVAAAVIDRYRAATVALGYTGDSVLNSASDIAMMAVGFVAARRLPLWASIAAVVVLELVPLAAIRDNLTLNVWMLLAPSDAIRAWQAGA